MIINPNDLVITLTMSHFSESESQLNWFFCYLVPNERTKTSRVGPTPNKESDGKRNHSFKTFCASQLRLFIRFSRTHGVSAALQLCASARSESDRYLTRIHLEICLVAKYLRELKALCCLWNWFFTRSGWEGRPRGFEEDRVRRMDGDAVLHRFKQTINIYILILFS